MSAFAFIIVALAVGGDPTAGSQKISVTSVLLSPIEEAEIAARAAGAITFIEARQGQAVTQGQLLVRFDNTEAELIRERTEIELEIARDRAKNNVSIRHAQKTLAVAKAELEQATSAVNKYPQSISDRELGRLKLTVERDELAVEQSEQEYRILQADFRAKQNELKLSDFHCDCRKVIAPFSGIVAELTKSRGEWVQLGDTVVRLLRIDRLKAEGFVDARHADESLLGSMVELSVHHANGTKENFPGKVVFLSPEVDPVNGQVLIWAEVENPQLSLRPGLRGTMTIETPRNQVTR